MPAIWPCQSMKRVADTPRSLASQRLQVYEIYWCKSPLAGDGALKFAIARKRAPTGAGRAYGLARFQLPPTPSPVMSPGLLSLTQVYSAWPL